MHPYFGALIAELDRAGYSGAGACVSEDPDALVHLCH